MKQLAYNTTLTVIAGGVRLKLSPKGSKRLAADEGDTITVATDTGNVYAGEWRSGAIEILGAADYEFDEDSAIRVRRVRR